MKKSNPPSPSDPDGDETDPEPLDIRVIKNMLQAAGITEYEEAVVPLLLDVVSSYTTEIVEVASQVAQHAGRPNGNIEPSDVQFALQSHIRMGHMFVPKDRESLANLAEERNRNTPLPTISPYEGVRIPSLKFSLTAPNYEALRGILPSHGATGPSNISKLPSVSPVPSQLSSAGGAPVPITHNVPFSFTTGPRHGRPTPVQVLTNPSWSVANNQLNANLSQYANRPFPK